MDKEEVVTKVLSYVKQAVVGAVRKRLADDNASHMPIVYGCDRGDGDSIAFDCGDVIQTADGYFGAKVHAVFDDGNVTAEVLELKQISEQLFRMIAGGSVCTK